MSKSTKTHAERIAELPLDEKVLTLAGAATLLGKSRQWGHSFAHTFNTARRIPGTSTVIVDRSEVESRMQEDGNAEN